jgi:hypothetical protein
MYTTKITIGNGAYGYLFLNGGFIHLVFSVANGGICRVVTSCGSGFSLHLLVLRQQSEI